ncbi:MAG: quinate 5-dehydrogenase, partial [Desulfotomaculaceae bacterium]|nr:quinate 5-dehydrogenase [Desulfotomaculaceae bacterium]
MKRVVSVSLGSSRRDHKVNIELLGEKLEIARVGTDGDYKRALELLGELDGQVDAIGLGGIDVYLFVKQKRYAIEDGLKLMEAVKVTPVVDGSGLKNTLEREVVRILARETDLLKEGARVMMVSSVDRFGMAEALAEEGFDMTFGDLIF